MQDEKTPNYSEGSKINWNSDKDITKKIIKKIQRNKKSAVTRVVEK
jgi:hypothetical protein